MIYGVDLFVQRRWSFRFKVPSVNFQPVLLFYADVVVRTNTIYFPTENFGTSSLVNGRLFLN